MDFLKLLPALLLVLTATTLEGCHTNATSQQVTEPAPVLLVCEHGSVKSVMAAALFNQGAADRHLPFRAIARGVTPDSAVPAFIATALGQEGLDVKDFVPVRVSEADVAHASRVVAIGVDPDLLSPGAEVSIDKWGDVPAASENYSAARASLKKHVDALLTELQQSRTQ